MNSEPYWMRLLLPPPLNGTLAFEFSAYFVEPQCDQILLINGEHASTSLAFSEGTAGALPSKRRNQIFEIFKLWLTSTTMLASFNVPSAASTPGSRFVLIACNCNPSFGILVHVFFIVIEQALLS